MGERFSAASRHGPRFEDGLREGCVAWQGMFPVSSLGPPAHPAGLRLGKLGGLQEKAWIFLLPHSPPDGQHTTDPWLNHFPNGPSLTAVDRTTAVLTNSWIGQLAVAHWQLAACGQGPLRHGAMAEQDLLSPNRVQKNEAQQWLLAKGCVYPALLHSCLLQFDSNSCTKFNCIYYTKQK